jgi:Holliday junction resolvasome RuvABC endonuclease subunit
LTNDPSLTAWGWAVVNNEGVVVDKGAIKTSPLNKVLKIRKGDDFSRRMNEISIKLFSVIKENNIQYILAERPHGSQSYDAAVMVGAVNSMMVSFSVILGIGLEWYGESEAKKAATDLKNITKDDMVELMKKEYNVEWTNIKWRDQAVADALAIHNVAKQQSSILKFLAMK